MFDFLHKENVTYPLYMLAPMSGDAISVREIPDEVFSEKILGDGVAIVPSSGKIVSPVNGEIVQVAETGHAFCIHAGDGPEILIHIGVDTVGLKGKGFETFVKKGQKVTAGEAIGNADLKLIEECGLPTHTAILITNMQIIDDLNPITGEAEAGKTKILFYSKK